MPPCEERPRERGDIGLNREGERRSAGQANLVVPEASGAAGNACRPPGPDMILCLAGDDFVPSVNR